MKRLLFIFCFIPAIVFAQKPNVVIILADDFGYEIPTVNGGQSYSTPNIDSMARHGVNFTRCHSTPVCATSRLALLSGKYNLRNYSAFGYMNSNEKTVGNLMKDAGYATAWYGKMQTYSRDSDIHNYGFSRYIVNDLSWSDSPLYKYKNPSLFVSRGDTMSKLALPALAYGDDVLLDSISAFIDSNKTRPFFIYYPMILPHNPAQPTPDDSDYVSFVPSPTVSDTKYFPSMVKYADKEIGKLLQKLRDAGVDSNTIVMFMGDNGTDQDITSLYNGNSLQGGKALTTEAGTHVPMIAYWPGHIAEGSVNNDLVDFTDFFPTLAEAAAVSDTHAYGIIDGQSFYSQLIGQPGNPKKYLYSLYDPFEGFYLDSFSRYIQDTAYKLYDTVIAKQSGMFYHYSIDDKEINPLNDSFMTCDERVVKSVLLGRLEMLPRQTPRPVITNVYARSIQPKSAIIGGTVHSDVPLSQRGTIVIQWKKPAIYNTTRYLSIDSLSTDTGTFEKTVVVFPQTRFDYSIFAMNSNSGNRMGYGQGQFMTLSNPPKSQPPNIHFKALPCAAYINWGAAVYPTSGATQAGYLLLYAANDTPRLIANPNGRNPNSGIVDKGLIAFIATSVLPTKPQYYDTVRYLAPGVVHNFVVIPFTWDGVNDSTRNYLTTGALMISGTPLSCGTANVKPLRTAELGYTLSRPGQRRNRYYSLFNY